jgi:hypothetical protein
MNVLSSLGFVFSTGNGNIEDPGPGKTINFRSISHGRVAFTGTGTRTLPSPGPGTELLATTTDTSTITLVDEAGATVAVFTGTSGTSGVVCKQMDANSWAAAPVNQSTANTTLQAIYTHLTSTHGFIDLPLSSWREVSSNDIINAAGNGGVMGTDTTPAYEYTNGDSDSQHRLLWAAGNADPITRQFVLPPDVDTAQPLRLRIVGKMSGLSDTPVMDVDTFFGSGDTKVEDATGAFSDSEVVVTATIAAADYGAPLDLNYQTVSIELTPGAHGSDSLAVYAIYVEYTRKLLTS